MRLLLLPILFFYTSLFANGSKVALQSCEAFNNIRHTKNSGDQKLEEGTSYHMIREQGDQYYVMIPAISVPNRWVDKNCFEAAQTIPPATKTDIANPVPQRQEQTKPIVLALERPQELLLALSWHHAFCETHRSRRECRPFLGAYRDERLFALHGLWPQPKENLYCDIPRTLKQYDMNKQWYQLPPLPLSEETRRALVRVMPGAASYLDRHEWVKHGSCFGNDAESYFKRAISLTLRVNRSKLGNFFVANIGRAVTIEQIRFKVDESFGKGSGKRIEMLCHDGMITELWFHLEGDSDDLSTLLKSGEPIRSRCRNGKIDRAGYR